MHTAKQFEAVKCPHLEVKEPSGLAVITLDDSARGDDGVASALCDGLSEAILNNVCRFDLGSHIGQLAECLKGHRAVVLIDTTENGTAPGTVSIVDLGAVLDKTAPPNIQSCHGSSLWTELRNAKKSGILPKRLIFFGIENFGENFDKNFGVENIQVDRKDRLGQNQQTKPQKQVQSLSFLVTKILETVKCDA